MDIYYQEVLAAVLAFFSFFFFFLKKTTMRCGIEALSELFSKLLLNVQVWYCETRRRTKPAIHIARIVAVLTISSHTKKKKKKKCII